MHISLIVSLLLLLGGCSRAALLGEVNGHRCLEPKDARGCCETWTQAHLGQASECPTTVKIAFACIAKSGDCIQWTAPGCENYYYMLKGMMKNPIKPAPVSGALCGQRRDPYDPKEYNKTFNDMFRWCNNQGGQATQVLNAMERYCPNMCTTAEVLNKKCQ